MTNFSQTATDIFSAIRQSKTILLHLHPGPDEDSIGSALAMYHILRGLNKKVTVIKGDSDLPEGFSVLPGFNEIVPKNFFDLDLSEFDLFIILDSAGFNMISKLAPVIIPDFLKTIVIDHHITNTGFGQINLIEPQISSVAEIIFDLLEAWQISLMPAVAINLFIGIYGDTGGFRWPPTGSKTLQAAAKLSQVYPDFPKVLMTIASQNTPGNMRFRALAYSLIKTLPGREAAYISLSNNQLVKNNLTKQDAENQNLSTSLISVKNWLVGISLVEKEPDKVFISCRSRDSVRYDVSKLAKLFGGGGHQAAAGAVFVGSSAAAEKVLIDNFNRLYPSS